MGDRWDSRIGCTRADTQSESRCRRVAKVMRKNLAHRTTQEFIKRIVHSLQKKPPHGTWPQYDEWRKSQVPHAFTPFEANLKTIATVIGLWRGKFKNLVAGEPGTWAPSSTPGVVAKMRVTNRIRKRKPKLP